MSGQGPPATQRRALWAVLALVVVSVLSSTAAGANVPAARERELQVTRGGRSATLHFSARQRSEALMQMTTSAPGVSWDVAGSESAVVDVSLDGRVVTDVVVPEPTAITREVDLGTVPAGRHTVHLAFDTAASPQGAQVVRITRVRFRLYAAASFSFRALSHAPILYGRDAAVCEDPSTAQTCRPGEGGPYQNAVTDTPLVAWHEKLPAPTPGHRVLKYSVVWSNEDGGTSTPALMARWGRTTDIEWVYQVEIDARGATVPGTAIFQSPNHETEPFRGTFEGDHPLLQTCTLNNNVCATITDPMRFALSTRHTLRASTQAREHIMDRNPWTYHVMAQEVRREEKVAADPTSAPDRLIADPREYLYVVVRKTTSDANDGPFWVGLALGVRLRGDPTTYRSELSVHPDWSLQRDDPAATAIRLPPGTKASDITAIEAIRVPFGPDTGATVEVKGINRAFLLDDHDRPQPSFVSRSVHAPLTPESPTAVLYRRR